MMNSIRFLRAASVAVAVLLAITNLHSQNNTPKPGQLLNTGSMGREFWIAIPPNEINPYPVDELEIYVASVYDTEITILDAAEDRIFKRSIKAGEVCTLSDKRGETNWTMEIREPEQLVRKGIRITSKQPISVYVLNSKTATSDGYMALPVESWDKEYIACSYYDFKEYGQWAGGFVVVAKEKTNVRITLRGTGKASGKTALGKSIGDVINVTLEAGDVYMVQGDGQTRGVFDLTGSSIVGDKPIGVIGFHMRTTMPNLLTNGNGRNHLVEMLPPLSQWGTQYATVELLRESKNGQGKGDVFRVVAKEGGTQWSLAYYDKTTKKLLGKSGGLIQNAGEFTDLAQSSVPTTLTNGYSVWTANKPIFVMQYSCSSSWDGDPTLDPFMINVLPIDQYATSTAFQVPTSAKFTKHRINLVVKADSSDPEVSANLKSLKMDDKPVWYHPNAQGTPLLMNRMPDGCYWATLDLGTEAKSHIITCNGKIRFGGFVYGYGNVDAYGWPITGGKPTTEVVTLDTMPPIIKMDLAECFQRTYTATELRNNPDPVRPAPQTNDQVERGIQSIRLAATSRNLRIELGKDSASAFADAPKSYKFSVQAVDTLNPSSGTIVVTDWNNNEQLDTISFTPPKRIDTLQPLVEFKANVGVLWDYEISDKRNIPDPAPKCPGGTIQEDRGLQRVQFDSLNVRLIRPLQRTFPAGTYTSSLTFEVIDITKSGWGCVTVSDNAGNSRNFCQQYNPSTEVEDTATPQGVTATFMNNQLNINATSAPAATQVQVLALDGRVVHTSIIGAYTVYSRELNLTPGVYVATLSSGGRPVSSLCFIVQE